MTSSFDVDAVRAEFPALSPGGSGAGAVFFDNPAGTQIAARALSRMNSAMVEANANLGGYFKTSLRAEGLIGEARETLAAFLNAADPREIVFGQNMTTLTFALSRAIGRWLQRGDEILLTRMDHDANVAPWLMLAEERGLEVRWLDFDPETCEFDLSSLDEALTDRTRVAAINHASNVTGTINDVRTIARRAKAVGALVYVDAVQFAPHGVIDVQELGCDFLVCSAYKFYGPHHGILWGRLELLEELEAYKVRPASPEPPGKFETGTKSREAIAGVLGAVEHFGWLGERFGGAPSSGSRRQRIVAGMQAAEAYERSLTERLVAGLRDFAGLRVHGIAETQSFGRRVPTVSFTVDGRDPAEIAEAMAAEDIYIWSGHNYGVEPIRRLGLEDKGGVVRVGLAHYNSAAEVERFLAAFGSWRRATS
ncbi:MAG: cysteine desulfurase-like protein [Rhizobiales bacterium]|nr:cysteine desulfurase-like protein [Hyphomicrobiales bacterium]